MYKRQDNEIVVVTSKLDKPQIGSIMSNILTDTLFTPQAEPYYKIIWVEPERFNDVKNYVNVVVAGIGNSPSNNGARLIKNLLSEEQYISSFEGDNHLIFSKNIFARDQNFLIINGPTFEKVNEQLSLTVGIPRIITQEFDVMFGGGVILGEMLSSTVTR